MKNILALIPLLVLSVSSVQAATVVLDFETATSGSNVNPFLPTGVSINPVKYDQGVDSFGDPNGIFSWQTDSGTINAVDSSVYGSALSITGSKALDVVFGPAWLQFATPGGLDSFSLTSGGLGGVPVDAIFLDSLGAEITRLTFDQSLAGVSTKALGGAQVASIVLPSGTLYDNITYVTSVPEPGRVSLLGLGLAAAVLRRRRI